jgi:hypothetical protein
MNPGRAVTPMAQRTATQNPSIRMKDRKKNRDHAPVINRMIPREHTRGGQQFGRAIAECSSCNTVMVRMIHGPEGWYTCCHSSADPVMGSHVHSAAVCVSVGHTTHSGKGMNVSASTVAASWDKPAPNCFDCGIKKQSAHRTLKRRPNLYGVYQERAQSTRIGTWCRLIGLTGSMAIHCYDPRVMSRLLSGSRFKIDGTTPCNNHSIIGTAPCN